MLLSEGGFDQSCENYLVLNDRSQVQMAVNLGKNPLLHSPLDSVSPEALDHTLPEGRFEHFGAFQRPFEHVQHILIDN